MSYFKSDFFKGNRQALIHKTEAELIVLTAHGMMQRSGDTTYPFRQESNFWYLTGLDKPDFLLVIGDGGKTEFLIAPVRDVHHDSWDGILDYDVIRDRSGITTILENDQGWEKLRDLKRKSSKIHTIIQTDSYIDIYGFYTNPSRKRLTDALEGGSSTELVDIRRDIAYLRQVKQPAEVAALESAVQITVESLDDVRRNMAGYHFEYEMAADITKGFIMRGALSHAYQPIVASGVNAANIHYMDITAPMIRGDLLLADVGAEVENYSADITRMFCATRPSTRQKQLHKLIESVHGYARSLLKPGITLRSYELDVDRVMAEHLHQIGLLRKLKDRKHLKQLYPHLTSHFLGLDTHDAADYDRPLEPGMVVTVEPGIYIPSERIGIRLEDDVIITDRGSRVLSASLPLDILTPEGMA
jgi:Xaa-Pro aminopeptidase